MDKDLIFAHEQAKIFKKKCNYNRIASYGYVTDVSFLPDTNNFCHAGLGDIPTKDVRYVVDIIYPSPNLTDEVHIAFIDYIMNCKAYEGVLIKQEGVVAFNNGYTLSNATAPSNQVAGCLMSLRMASERWSMIQTWWELVCLGFDKDFAYILCHSIVIDDDNKMFIKYSVETHHIGIDVSVMGERGIYNYKDGVLVNPNKPLNISVSYHSVSTLFGSFKSFHPIVERYIKDSIKNVKEVRQAYLFYKPPIKDDEGESNRYPYDEKIKQVLLSFNKMFEERTL